MAGTGEGRLEIGMTAHGFGRYIWALTLYCAGRQTYAPSVCEGIIRRNAESIHYPWRAHIIGLVMTRFASTFEGRVAAEREKREAKAAGNPDWWTMGYKGGPLGADFDEDGWVQAATYLAKHDRCDPAVTNACWDGDDPAVTVTFDDVDDLWFMVCCAIRHDLCGGDAQVMAPAGHLAFVEAHADLLNAKWVTNMLRDLDDGFYASFGTDMGEWDGLRGALEAWRAAHPDDFRR